MAVDDSGIVSQPRNIAKGFGMTKLVTGRCFCGASQFGFDHLPVATRACWCRNCHYLTSGNASINAIFKTIGLELTGETREYVSKADSGTVMRRHFCGRCGTPLFNEAQDRPDLTVVRAGALDDPAIGSQGGVIWTASAPSWELVDPTLPSCEGQLAAAPLK